MKKRREAKEPEREWEIDVPNDPANEQVVIAAMLVADEDTLDRLLQRAPVDAFYADEHKAIRDAIGEARRQRLAIDPATLQRLRPEVDIRILEKYPEARPDVPDNLGWHVDNLLWDWHRAQATRGPISALLEAVQDPKQTVDRVRALARQVGAAFEGAESRAPFLRDPADVIRDMVGTLRRRASGEAFYPFGIPGLDFDEAGAHRCRPGAAPGMATILTGMSGSGKSSFAAHMILGLARQKRRVLVGAWEVRAPMTLELLAVLSLRWSRSRVLDGRSNRVRNDAGKWSEMTGGEIVEIEEKAHAISKYVRFLENPFSRGSVRKSGRVTNDDYLDILEDHVEAAGCDVALFDLFDRVLRNRRPDDEQEALWRLLELTNRLQIHSVVVHQQLMKGDDVRPDKRPSLAGLKGSSAYVDAGAIILAPHLPARWKPGVDDDKMEVFGLKLRFAPPFAVEFDWEPDTGQISGGRTFDAKDAIEPADDVFGAPSRRKPSQFGKRFGDAGKGRRR